MSLKTRIALSLAAVALWQAPAVAADYDPPIIIDNAPEYVPVEIGSGWYLRGDIAYTFDRNYKDTSLAFDDSLFNNNLIGLGWLGPVDVFSFSEKENPVSGSLGFGYHINDYLRADINVGLLASDKYSGTGHLLAGYLTPPSLVNSLNPAVFDMPDFGCLGSRTITTTTYDADGEVVGQPQVSVDSDWRRDCMVNATAKNTAWNGLVNGYLDLGTYAGFTPYVGAGIGMLYTRTKVTAGARCEDSSVSQMAGNTQTVVDFNCRAPGEEDYTTVASYSHSDYNLLYALSAGVSYQFSRNTSLDVGYQYLNAPGIEYLTLSSNGIEAHKGIDYHQIKVGLRYDLW